MFLQDYLNSVETLDHQLVITVDDEGDILEVLIVIGELRWIQYHGVLTYLCSGDCAIT